MKMLLNKAMCAIDGAGFDWSDMEDEEIQAKPWALIAFYKDSEFREEEPKKARENNAAPIMKIGVSDDENDVDLSLGMQSVQRSQRPRGNQRNWNGQKSNQLGCNFVFNNKACFICGSFDHIQYSCPNVHKHMAPRAVLMKTGLKTVNTARPVNIVRSVNTGRPFSTVRSLNTVRHSYTAHP
ncbi:hypothetical protein Tco_0750729 [Tanacetum coccineum]|uniref:CCHC-type domain-containing protein n=1 Tax=Tanacetum coccineum TaxID=301880 RepID=A0ABQ4Z5Q4_9ASTR